MLILTETNKVKVVNAINTANLPLPEGYNSWISYWNDQKNKTAGCCRHRGKKTSKLDGAHVQYVKKNVQNKWQRVSGLFLVPLCTECNNPKNNNIFSVKKKDLISAPQP
jgi:hypothetical protein